MSEPRVDHAGRTVTVRVPFKIRVRGGRKLIVAPEGVNWSPQEPRYDNALIKALGRAFRWRKLLERGDYATTRDLAAAEKINASFVSRLLRLTLLAPDIIEAILAGEQGAMQLADLVKPLPRDWGGQRHALGFERRTGKAA